MRHPKTTLLTLGASKFTVLRRIVLPQIMPGILSGSLIVFALTASESGYRTILLGADMPLGELPAAARKTACDAIVLAGLVKPSSEVLERQLPELLRGTRVPVFVGGRASTAAAEALRRAGVEVLGSDTAQGLNRLREQVPLSAAAN